MPTPRPKTTPLNPAREQKYTDIALLWDSSTRAVSGALIIFAWYSHIPAILQLRPDLPPMQFNTALCLVLSGAGLCTGFG